MKVYIYDQKTNGAIVKICAAAGVETLTREDVVQRHAQRPRNELFLDNIDLFIINITKPSQEIHFILAQAILSEKPTLCVYGKNQTPAELMQYIRKPGPRRRNIRTFSYTAKTLETGIRNFIRLYDPAEQRSEQIASVKFTLRLTPHIDRYLDWCVQKTGESKADMIRRLLEQKATADKKYTEDQQ